MCDATKKCNVTCPLSGFTTCPKCEDKCKCVCQGADRLRYGIPYIMSVSLTPPGKTAVTNHWMSMRNFKDQSDLWYLQPPGKGVISDTTFTLEDATSAKHKAGDFVEANSALRVLVTFGGGGDPNTQYLNLAESQSKYRHDKHANIWSLVQKSVPDSWTVGGTELGSSTSWLLPVNCTAPSPCSTCPPTLTYLVNSNTYMIACSNTFIKNDSGNAWYTNTSFYYPDGSSVSKPTNACSNDKDCSRGSTCVHGGCVTDPGNGWKINWLLWGGVGAGVLIFFFIVFLILHALWRRRHPTSEQKLLSQIAT